MTWSDAIVDEVRRARDAYAGSTTISEPFTAI